MAAKSTGTTSSGHAANSSWNPITRMVCKYTDDFFDKLDVNSDGVLSFDEVYEIMLLVSIKVNRQAPIPPPTKETARILFKKADVDNSGSLSKKELRTIVLLAMPRTTSRLVAYKILQYGVAPMVALKTVNALDGNIWLEQLGMKWVPKKFHDIVLRKDFWKLSLSISFLYVVGILGLIATDWVYDTIFKLRPVDESKKDK